MHYDDRLLDRALNHSPKHRRQLEAVVRDAGSDIKNIARALGAKCRELRLRDFPNPFPGGDNHFGHQALHKMWEACFAGEEFVDDETGEPDFVSMTKDQIEDYMLAHYEVNLPTSITKAEMIRRAEQIMRGDPIA